jgi:hypothetical protein
VMVAWTILGVALTALNILNLMSAPDPQ